MGLRPATSARRILLAALAPLLALGAMTLTQSSLEGRLPNTLAIHAGVSGNSDRFTATSAFLPFWALLLTGAAVVLITLTIALRRIPPGQRAVVGVNFAVSTSLTLTHAMILVSNLDAADPAAVVFPWWTMILPPVGAIGGGLLGYLFAGHIPARKEPKPAPEDAPRVRLASGERASWSRSVVSGTMLLFSVAVGVLALLVGLTAAWPVLILLVPAITMALMSSARVIVDGEGLSVRPTLFRWPHKHIELGRIRLATAGEVNPSKDFGGWGYRFRGDRAGVVLRSGEALVVELTDGSEFLVTVDDAHTGAALLNTLAERARTLG